jgi:signal transduction histidine kinase
MAAGSIGLGWLAAGRVLRPLRTINERARAISATNLHRRLALTGPDDELGQLADTFDELLERLEASFTAQRQFVANASHELRTPLARAQTLAEIALSDPGATVESLKASHRRVLAAGKQQERLIEALLTLARSERGVDEREPFDLARIADGVLRLRRPEAERRGLYVHASLEPADTSGDPRLAERLVANLVDNALRHNVPSGRIDITTTTANGQAVLSIANTGLPVPPAELERLFQPFQRLGADRTDHSNGTGLGLSIVAAIAGAHGATHTAYAQPGGGLEIEVSFASGGGGAAGNGAAPEAQRTPPPAARLIGPFGRR